VIRFLSAPLVTLWSNNTERLSASDFSVSISSCTRAVVNGPDLSVTRLTNAYLVMFSPFNFPTIAD
jgi:hypothetical protein